MADQQKSQQAALLKEKQRYVQGYLRVVQSLYRSGAFTPAQSKLAQLAYERRLPPSGFVQLVRQKDPDYPKTSDFRSRNTEARDVWDRFRPGRPMPADYSAQYVRSGLNKLQLIEKVQKSVSAKAPAFPGNGVKAYQQLRELLNGAYQERHGQTPDPILHRLIFHSNVSDADIHNSIPQLFGGKDSFRWMQGAPDSDVVVRSAIRKNLVPPAPKLSSAPTPFLSDRQNAFDIGVGDMSAGLISSDLGKE